MSHTQRNALSGQHMRGFSLVELMVALAIGLVLIAGLTTLLVGNMQGFGELNKATYQIENARYASQFLRDELRTAGYYGNLTFLSEPPAFPASVCPTSKSSVADRYDIPLQGWNEVSASSGDFNCVSNMKVVAGTDVLLVRRAATVEIDPATRSNEYMYLAMNVSQMELLAGAESASGVLILSDPRFNKVRRLYERILYVSQCSVCSGTDADTIPTLKMIELGNGSWSSAIPLVEGVENMQVDYGIDADENGVPERWVALPANRDEWASVAAVRFHLLMRNVEETRSFKDPKKYSLGLKTDGSEQTVGPFSNGFKRHVYTMTVRLLNTADRREN